MEGITEIDMIILSYAYNSELRAITKKCINSLVESENSSKIKFNILVVESEKSLHDYQYQNTTTIYPANDFGYNKYLNIGIEATSSKYICLCNNDLIFHRSWATEMLNAFNTYYDLSSASPICSKHHPRLGFEINNGLYTGYRNRYEVAGWCLFLKRDVLRITGKLDENFRFWCADNDYANTMASLHLGHALISSSIVDHLGEATSGRTMPENDEHFTANEFFYFEKKWNCRVGKDWHPLDLEKNIIPERSLFTDYYV